MILSSLGVIAGRGSSSLNYNIYAVYNGESNANDSFGSNNGTAMGGLTYTTGKIGNAFSFNGTNAYVQLPDSSMRFTGDFSISCWVYLNSTSTYQVFVENFYATNISNRYGWALYYQSGKIRFGTYNLSTAITVSSTTLLTGQWYHIVVSKTVSTIPKIYINSILETTTNDSGSTPQNLHPAYNSNNIPRFGVDVDSGIWSSYLNGKLDSVSTWQKELTQSEITELYNSGNGKQYPF